MEKNLEKIFWKDGKFIKANGEEVKPKPIGEPVLVDFSNPRTRKENLERVQLPKLIQKDESYQEINAYLEKEDSVSRRRKITWENALTAEKRLISISYSIYNLYKI